MSFSDRRGSTSHSNRRASTLGSVVKKFDILDLSAVTSPQDIFWNGLLLAAADDICQGKLNFCLELLALDHCLVSWVGMTTQETADWDALLLNCFSDQCLINANFSHSPIGLGSQDYIEWMEFVETFQELGSSWPGPVAAQLAKMKTYKLSGPHVKGGWSSSVYCKCVRQ